MFASNRVHASYRHWSAHLPTLQPHYAVKSNPDPLLLKTLSSLGSGFDCASGKELEEVAALGSTPAEFQHKVVYANPCKPNRDLKIATKYGSPTTVVDSFEEVEKLKENGYTGKSLIRILVNDTSSLMPFSRKFGLCASKVKDLSFFAKSQGIEIDGISFHVGSGCYENQQYRSAIQLAHSCITSIREVGFGPSTVDIGGGFTRTGSRFQEAASVIRASLVSDGSLRYIAEPGRYFSESAFDLFVQVIGKKPSNDGTGWRYTLDESLYGQFSCIPFDQQIPTWVRIAKENEPPRKPTKGILFGRTCDSLDMIARSPSMEELMVGDWLWFPNMGAYTTVTASEFNGFPKPPVLFVENQVSLPVLDDLAKDTLRNRRPFDVTTVTGVTVGASCIPAVA